MHSPLRLLLADDNLPDRLLAETAFETIDDVQVTFCEDGRGVLQTLLDPDAIPPHVIVLDLNMPVLDGHETLRLMREHPALRHYPVVILTSSQEPQDIAQAYDGSAALYLVKDLDYHVFVEQMRAFVSFFQLCHFALPVPTGHSEDGDTSCT